VLAKELATKDKDELIHLLGMFSPETSVWAEVILRGNAAINVQNAGASQKVLGTAVGLWLTRIADKPALMARWRSDKDVLTEGVVSNFENIAEANFRMGFF